MTLKKYSPALVTGFAAAAISLIPIFKALSCCFILPAAAFFSLFFYLKINPDTKKIKFEEALLFGLFTGIVAALFASVFDVILTYITRTNDFIESLPYSKKMIEDYNMAALLKDHLKIMDGIEKEVSTKGFSFFYTLLIIFSNLITFVFFGILGALLGMSFLNKKKTGDSL